GNAFVAKTPRSNVLAISIKYRIKALSQECFQSGSEELELLGKHDEVGPFPDHAFLVIGYSLLESIECKTEINQLLVIREQEVHARLLLPRQDIRLPLDVELRNGGCEKPLELFEFR